MVVNIHCSNSTFCACAICLGLRNGIASVFQLSLTAGYKIPGSTLWSAIVDKIHVCTIASTFPYMISTSRSLMFMYRSSMSMFRSCIDHRYRYFDHCMMFMYRSSMLTFRSWIASYVSISSIDVDVGCCILYRYTLSLSSMFPSSEVWGQNARA